MRLPLRTVLPLLFGLALPAQTSAKGTGLVFVSNEAGNTVAVIDPAQDDRVIKWIRTSRWPGYMKFRDNQRQVLVACRDDDVIDVIDVATLAVTDHIPTGANPEAFEVSPDEAALYVPDKRDSKVHVISLDEKIIDQTISTGAEPGGIAVSDDGKTLYVTSEISDWVHVVDLPAGAVTDNIAVGTRPKRVLLLSKANELWVSNEVSGEVSIIDRAARQVSATLGFRPPGYSLSDAAPEGMAATRDGKTAFVSLGRADAVAFIDTSARTVRHYVSAGRGVVAVALAADEATLYVVNSLSDDVTVLDVSSQAVIKAVPVGRAPHSVLVDDRTAGMPAADRR